MGALTQAGWQRIEELLHGALALSPQRRVAYLDRACGNDAELRREVEGLIACADTDPGRFEQPVALRVVKKDPPPVELAAGARLGAWRIERLIGRGGMGEVYLAARADGQYQQQAAVKLMRPEAIEHLERFHAERQILAKLEHPGIARLLDSGVVAGERPYMLMEYVAGQPLTEYCRERRLTLRARIGLFLQVCEAVSYAHAHLVIHRDLKPGNILVTGDGRAKLLDFGIAKLLDAERPGDATVTRAAPMTPSHAAPEQLSGEPVSTATDVYALGVVLYELLAGRGPWQLAQLPVSVAIHKLLHEDAPPASRVAAETRGAPVEPRALQGDLDAILSKALRKEPVARYATVSALRDDLQRYLDGEPVSAGPASALYRARKFVRRHYLAVGAAAAAVVVVAVFMWRLAVERDRALAAVATSQAVTAFLSQDMFAQIGSDQRPLKELTIKEVLDGASVQVDARFTDHPEAAAEVHMALGASYTALDDVEASSRHLDRALLLLQEQGETASDRVLEIVAQQVLLKYILNQLPASITHYEALRDRARKTLGSDHPEVVRLAQQIAWGRRMLGDWVLARQQLRQVLAEIPDGGDEMFKANTERILSMVLLQLGDNAEAERLLRGALARLVPKVGEKHVRVAQVRTYLAEALTRQGRLEEADREMSAGLKAAADWAPNQAMDYLLRAHITQAQLRLEQGRIPEAIQVLEASLASYLQQKKPEERDQSPAWRRPLAEAYQRSGQFAAAVVQARLAYEASVRWDGPGHPEAQRLAIELADALVQVGRFGEARSVMAGLERKRLAELPADHAIFGEMRRIEGLLELEAGNRQAADQAMREALSIIESRYGAWHWRARRARADLTAATTSVGN